MQMRMPALRASTDAGWGCLLQGAKYMTMTYPFHCDPLAFTDALHEQEAAPA